MAPVADAVVFCHVLRQNFRYKRWYNAKKPGMNEWGEYFYSFTRSCPVIILPAKAVNCSDTTNLLIFLCVGHIISRRNAAKSQPPRM
jgi:hypothetical protein